MDAPNLNETEKPVVKLFNREKKRRINELQKGKHLMSLIHKPFEDLIVYLLFDLEFIGADHVSLFTYFLASLTVYFFLTGKVALALAFALVAGVMDGVDGKIARLRGRKTFIGKLEHSLDMLYEQAWYASFTWWAWNTTGSTQILILGLIWLILDAYVRHVYNVVWIATGKSLKYHGGIASYVTFIDGRRSFYVLHMVIWLLLSAPWCAIYTILVHCALTATAYTALSFRAISKHTQP